MSKPDKPKRNTTRLAGYGLHYYATNQLIPSITERAVFQCLLDHVRAQLNKSWEDQTVLISQESLRTKVGISNRNTIKNVVNRLAKLGLITVYSNGYKIHCDEFVTLVKNYEALDEAGKKQLVYDFEQGGISVVQKCTIPVEPMCRQELLGLTGSSITVESPEMFKSEQFDATEDENCSKVNTLFKSEHPLSNTEICSKLNNIAELLAKTVQNCTSFLSECSILNILDCSELNIEEKMLVKEAILTGKVPESVKNNPENLFTFEHVTCSLLNIFTSKPVQFRTPVIIEDKIEKIKEGSPLEKGSGKEENEEDYREEIRKGLEGFGKVEIIDLDKPSDEDKEEVEDFSQLELKRAERKMRENNSYRKKPFLSREKVEDIVACLNDPMDSPVEFFIYLFWWGIFDLYCDHYNPSSKIDEHGDPEDVDPGYEWREMLDAPLPQDEIYRVAQNAYEELLGAVEQGKYTYGDYDNEYTIKLGFDSFEDFMPYKIFQWTPCTMQDKSIPALRVAIDKFYDIEAPDVFTPTRGDKRAKNAQNRKMTLALLEATDDTQLTPMEAAIKKFYQDFVILGENGMVDVFTDGRGTVLELGGGLPDHLLKPWCYGIRSVGYNGFTSVTAVKYKPIEGLHRRSYLFSAEAVVEWNERNGYHDTLAHQALQE